MHRLNCGLGREGNRDHVHVMTGGHGGECLHVKAGVKLAMIFIWHQLFYV
jgi:hypothetical protein